jgi:large subunit ribosomal protein L30e
MIDVEKVIKSADTSGRMFLGSKKAMDAAKSGRAVVLILSSNCPPKTVDSIQRHAHLSNIPVCIYPSTSADLGMICGKPFSVSAVTIRSLSDQGLLQALERERDLAPEERK